MVNRQIRFPVELWVAICGLLSPKDQRSLATSCKRLFAIVYLNPPSTVARVDKYGVTSTVVHVNGSHATTKKWSRKDRLYLRSATDVHWSGNRGGRAEKWRFQAMLSVLLTTPNIRFLSLSNVDINETQQAIIFGISALRTLEVESCVFDPSTKPLPLSRVNALKCVRTDLQTIRRLLTLLATTVESLDVLYDGGTIGSTLQDGLIELPKLSSFTMKDQRGAAGLAILNTFNQYKSITTICITFEHNPPKVSFHHSDLPALRNVTCDQDLAVSLIPQRPVTTYGETRSTREGGRKRLFNSLSKTRAKITNLKLLVPFEFYSLLPSLATSLHHLEQLTLRGGGHDTDWLERYALNGRQTFNTPGAVVATLPKLKRITCWVDKHMSTAFPLEVVVKIWVIPVCPALEVFECLTFSCTPNFEDDWLTESARVWKVRRLPDRSWERQGPPPIPTPVPAKKLGAVP